jgi:uncharacterized protein YybS (DUF2232 family)
MAQLLRAERSDPRGAGVVGGGLSSALLFSAALFVPLLFPVATLAAFPVIIQRLRRGLLAAIGSALLAMALLAGAFSAEPAQVYALVLAVPGLLIGEAMARGRGLVRGCRWAFLWVATVIGVALLFDGPELAQHALQPFEQYRSPAFLEGMRSSGLPPERVEDLADRFALAHSALKIVYPAAFLILGALLVMANAVLLKAYLARRDPGWLDGGEFENLRFGLGMAVLFVASGAAVLSPSLRPAAYNALLLLAFFFALQGLAVVAYYAHRLAGPPLLRIAVVVLVLVNPWAPQILALLGLFDIWFNFRKWAEVREGQP